MLGRRPPVAPALQHVRDRAGRASPSSGVPWAWFMVDDVGDERAWPEVARVVGHGAEAARRLDQEHRVVDVADADVEVGDAVGEAGELDVLDRPAPRRWRCSGSASAPARRRAARGNVEGEGDARSMGGPSSAESIARGGRGVSPRRSARAGRRGGWRRGRGCASARRSAGSSAPRPRTCSRSASSTPRLAAFSGRQAASIAAEVQLVEGVGDDGAHRLAHVALPREGLADPVAECARLRRPAPDVVERDRAEQRVVRLARIRNSGTAVPAGDRPAAPSRRGW